MAKIYSGGIEIATGFKLLDEQPIADYMAVDDIIDLDNLPNQFKGMLTFVDEDDNLWMKGNGGWKIVGANAASYNYLISVESVSVLNNNITYGKVKASIDGNTYQTTGGQVIYVPYASAGNTRKDRIVINKFSNLVRIQGTESTTIAVAEPTPQGTVSVDILDVDDNSINSNPNGVDGAYVSKISQGIVRITGAGVLSPLELPMTKHIELFGTITKVTNMVVSEDGFYNGFEYRLTNEQSTPIDFEPETTIKLVGGVVRTINPTETITFSYDDSNGIFTEMGVEKSTADNNDTIATKIEITFADLGVTTIAEVTDAIVLTYINGLGLVKSRKEFYVVSVEDLRYIITDLPEGLVNITEDQLLKFDGSGSGTEPSVIFPDTEIYYTGSKSFTIEEGVKVLTFKKNGSGISINWTQVGNIITYNGLEDLNTDDYFIYNGVKAVSIVEVSGDVPDATTTIKGKLKLAGDLAGTADAPTVPALANIYTKTEVDAKVSSVYVVKESVATLAALNALTGQVIGWVRNVNDSGMNYVYTASGWDALGATVDVSGKEDKSNKGIANGYAPLGADLKVPSSFLPTPTPIDVSGKEDISNKKTDIEANKTSNVFYAPIKTWYDWITNRLIRKVESLLTSPVQITKKWNGTQDEMRAVIAEGVDPNTEYAYVKIINVVRNPTLPQTYVLDDFDNETNQIIETNCTINLPSGVVDFGCMIIVLTGATLTLTGGASLVSIIGSGSTGNQTLTKGCYKLTQKGATSTFILC